LAESVRFTMTKEFQSVLTREERRSLFLHQAIASRLAQDPAAVLARARATLSRMLDKQPGATRLLRQWEVPLERPLPELTAILTDPAPWARELRHVTPFAGILTAAERAATYRAFAEAERDA
jgi:hypothetical protein